MQITIDGRALVGNRTGIGVHTAQIARRLSDAPLIASHAEIVDRSGLEHCAFRVDPMPFGVAWQQLVLPRIATEGVLWAPHGTVPLALRIPSVATLHDFSSLTMPFRHRAKTMLSFNLFIGRSLQMATRIAAVSRAVAEEAVRWFGVSRSRIEIVPNGVDEFFTPDGDEDDYVLYVGTIEPRKGLDDLLAVWDSLPPPRPRLILCGDAGWGDVQLPRDAELTGYVDRARLRELYRYARAFVYPSRYEGFGIPPLEAMACGAPVVATRTGAIPEYADGAALLVDPGDRDALRDALIRMLSDKPLRSELRARGPERARMYTWDRSAALMTQLFAEAAR
ncbi:MAG TPA: glycosyltransferase family 1 protein [Thermoanaerobaculia bacterium]|jgi:glycosyltransferase involved in cell wall biosynthesis|nr:glycosyltransferase family 1 protein [Thermoanaerobaculia bacterium]